MSSWAHWIEAGAESLSHRRFECRRLNSISATNAPDFVVFSSSSLYTSAGGSMAQSAMLTCSGVPVDAGGIYGNEYGNDMRQRTMIIVDEGPSIYFVFLDFPEAEARS